MTTHHLPRHHRLQPAAKPPEPKQAGTFIGLNPKTGGLPLTLQDCQCRACCVIRARNEKADK